MLPSSKIGQARLAAGQNHIASGVASCRNRAARSCENHQVRVETLKVKAKLLRKMYGGRCAVRRDIQFENPAGKAVLYSEDTDVDDKSGEEELILLKLF